MRPESTGQGLSAGSPCICDDTLLSCHPCCSFSAPFSGSCTSQALDSVHELCSSPPVPGRSLPGSAPGTSGLHTPGWRKHGLHPPGQEHPDPEPWSQCVCGFIQISPGALGGGVPLCGEPTWLASPQVSWRLRGHSQAAPSPSHGAGVWCPVGSCGLSCSRGCLMIEWLM